MQHYIDVRLNCCDEPKPVTSYFDDRLIERDLVGILAAVRLEIRLCIQLRSVDLVRFTPKLSGIDTVLESDKPPR